MGDASSWRSHPKVRLDFVLNDARAGPDRRRHRTSHFAAGPLPMSSWYFAG